MAIHWHLNYEGKGIHVCASHGVSQSWIICGWVILSDLFFECWKNNSRKIVKSWWILDWKGAGKFCFWGVSGSLLILVLLFTVVRWLWWYFAAVYFEQGEYEKCIAECEKAVEVGREQRADFTIIAKWVLIRFQPLLPFGVATINELLSLIDLLLNTVMAGFTVPWPWLPRVAKLVAHARFLKSAILIKIGDMFVKLILMGRKCDESSK